MESPILDAEIDQIPPQYKPYATFWERFGAAFLDGIILTTVGYLILGAFGISFLDMYQSSTGGDDPVDIFGANFTYASILSLIFDWFYFAQQESSEKQATLGKQALGLIVTDLDAKRITFAQASVRFVIKQIIGFISLLSAFLPPNVIATLTGMSIFGYLIQPFTKRKQAFHDIVAKTLVYKK